MNILQKSMVAKFKCPRVLDGQKISEDNQEISEDNQKLRPGSLSHYQIFCEIIYPEIVILTNLSSYLSLTNKNKRMRTNTTYI